MPRPQETSSSLNQALWQVAKKQWPLLLVLGLISVVTQAVSLGLPYITKVQLDLLAGDQSSGLSWLRNNDPFILLAVLIVISLALSMISALTTWFEVIVNSKVSYRIGLGFDRMVYGRLRQFDASLLSGKRSWFIVRNANSGTDLIWSLSSMASNLFAILLGLGVIVPIISAIDQRLLLVVLVASVLQLVLVLKGVRLERESTAETDALRNLSWINSDALTGANYLQLATMNADRPVIKRLHQYATKSYLLDMALTKRRNLLDAGQSAVRYGALAVVTWLVGQDILLGLYTVGTFVLLYNYAEQLQSALVSTLDLLQSSAGIRLNALKYGYLFSLESSLVTSSTAKRLPPKVSLANTRLVLDNISFAYPDMAKHERDYLKHLYGQADKMSNSILGPKGSWATDDVKEIWQDIQHQVNNPEVVHGLRAVIEPGSLVALVGPNGAGKSTLAKLLVRNYDPTHGSITLNGEDYRQLDLESLHGQVSLLTQDPFHVEGYSIRDNLQLGTGRVTEKRIWQVLKQVGIDSQIRRFPKGLHTQIGRDADLSGGQRQLLAAARVLIQKRPIIIFDEATSQLDAVHELKFVKQLKQLKNQATIVMITHRLTTARHADKILVLDKGKIVQEGDHQKLKQEDGIYRQFWLAQVGS